MVEAVDESMLLGEPTIPSGLFERALVVSFERYMSVLQALDVGLPVFVFLNLLGVNGYRMALRDGEASEAIDRGDGSQTGYSASSVGPIEESHVYADNGVFTVTITVTDNDGAAADSVTTATIANVAPVIDSVSADPAKIGQTVNINTDFTDPGTGDTHTATVNWGDGSPVEAGVVDAGTITGSHVYADTGIYTVTLTVTDDEGASDEAVYRYAVVYDPAGGFVTGGGWIDSPAAAYVADAALAGKANLGFVTLYDKDDGVVKGETQFNFHGGSMAFHSTSLQWFYVDGNTARYGGTGTVNDTGDYGFSVAAFDSQGKGRNRSADGFRIRIWDNATGEVVVYDNQPGEGDLADAVTPLGAGSIVIHQGKEK